MDRRHLANTLLLAVGLCGCASQHHRTESASAESSRVAGSEGAVDSEANDGESVRATSLDADDTERNQHAGRDPDTARDPSQNVAAGPRLDTPNAPDTAADDTTARDNTGVNERDRGGETLTPGDQGNSASDLEITRRIRETVVDDDSLSFTAKNVKIITVDGRVTLRGPVSSQAERTNIEKKALAVAGAGHVVNQLEIK